MKKLENFKNGQELVSLDQKLKVIGGVNAAAATKSGDGSMNNIQIPDDHLEDPRGFKTGKIGVFEKKATLK